MNKYIANCIDHILGAETHPTQRHQRCRDIAEAVSIAATKGDVAAHQYLLELSGQAQSGCYAKEKKS